MDKPISMEGQHMKVTVLEKDELLIEPETDFEADWMQRLGNGESGNRKLEAFHKSGLSVGDYVGIKVRAKGA